MRRAGAGPRMGRTSTCGNLYAAARPGMTATPRLAAANAWTAMLSSVVRVTRGSNPAARQVCRTMRNQVLAGPPPTRVSSASSVDLNWWRRTNGHIA
jgi:hypothetical protein